MPQQLAEHDIDQLFPEIAQIGDLDLRAGIRSIWIEVAAAMSWDRLEDVPQNTRNMRHRQLVSHIRGVTKTALAIAEIANMHQGRSYDKDVLLAACLLHDVSKPLETEPDRQSSDPTSGKTSELGRQLPHAVYATHKVIERSLPLSIAHIVVTHTHYCAVRGNSWESAILFYADYADSDAGLSLQGGEMYSRRWTLD